MGAETGVYSIEEAIKEGLYTPPVESSPQPARVFDMSRRHTMFDLCNDTSNSGYMFLQNLRNVYQNEVPIDDDVRRDYLEQISIARSSINRNLDELERLFNESFEKFLVEKTLNEYKI